MGDSQATPPAHALPPHAQVVQMAGGQLVSRTIYVVAELGIADLLRDGPRTAEDLAEATNAHAPTLYRLLRTASGLGLFAEDSDRRFALRDLGAALRSDAQGYARSAVRMLAGPLSWSAFGELLQSVRTGESGLEKAFGQSIFDYLSTNPDDATLFNETMIGFHGMEPPAVAAAYDFSGVRTLVDVGGGTGNLVTTILLANPHLEGVLFDLPHVAAEARAQVEAKGLSDRCTILEGSFFDSVPTGGDAYLLSHIIHDWDEARCLTILDACRRAMHDRARLLVVEQVIPPGNDFHPAKLLDLMMLAYTPGGRERTEAEYAELFAKAGLSLTRIVPTESAVSVVEAEPVATEG